MEVNATSMVLPWERERERIFLKVDSLYETKEESDLSTNIQILYHVFKSFPCAYDALRACLKVQPLQLHSINTDCQIPKRW